MGRRGGVIGCALLLGFTSGVDRSLAQTETKYHGCVKTSIDADRDSNFFEEGDTNFGPLIEVLVIVGEPVSGIEPFNLAVVDWDQLTAPVEGEIQIVSSISQQQILLGVPQCTSLENPISYWRLSRYDTGECALIPELPELPGLDAPNVCGELVNTYLDEQCQTNLVYFPGTTELLKPIMRLEAKLHGSMLAQRIDLVIEGKLEDGSVLGLPFQSQVNATIPPETGTCPK